MGGRRKIFHGPAQGAQHRWSAPGETVLPFVRGKESDRETAGKKGNHEIRILCWENKFEPKKGVALVYEYSASASEKK